jgi:hypothetical protein
MSYTFFTETSIEILARFEGFEAVVNADISSWKGDYTGSGMYYLVGDDVLEFGAVRPGFGGGGNEFPCFCTIAAVSGTDLGYDEHTIPTVPRFAGRKEIAHPLSI